MVKVLKKLQVYKAAQTKICKIHQINIIFKNCTPYMDHITKTNNTQTDHQRNLRIMMLVYNLLKYIDKYGETSVPLDQYTKNVSKHDIIL